MESKMESKKDSRICIHIFRRDYRLYDNTTLIHACKTFDIVIPVFIFTEKQISPRENPYRSDNAVQFLCESLVDLDKQLRVAEYHSQLYIYYGNEFQILEELIKTLKPLGLVGISFNADYTKYSQERDSRIQVLCKTNAIQCLVMDDICLNAPGTILTTGGKVYTKFTPFWRASSSKDIRKSISNVNKNYLQSKHTIAKKILGLKNMITLEDVMKPNGKILGTLNPNLIEHGGRDHGLSILKRISTWQDYNDEHDQLTYATTHLSAFNKYGCVSIREVFHAMLNKLGKDNDVVRQLFWRDFFYHLSAKFPEIYQHALNPKYRNIHWVTNKAGWKAWCEGRTGFPIVDACMRELNTTGYMHNRGRLIVSNFLCRLMHQDWKDGERYFATQLYDYDPAQNNFGWQVSGANSSGTTSRPLEQTILNPWLQSIQFDPTGEYIKKWCPELKDVNPRDLHKWDSVCDTWLNKGVKYLKPMLDYKTEKEKNLKMYRNFL
jgi:deoxyribodipyrimidine photo-lyase